MKRRFASLCLLGLASCSNGAEQTAVNVTIIGGRPVLSDPDRGPVNPATAALLGATAQGMVGLDAAGQVVPGLAERWIVTDDGLSLIFRIKRAKWADGRNVTSEDVAAELRRLQGSANRVAPYLAGIEKISSMTGRVIEIRLSSPQPRLLELLAQPEAAVTRKAIGAGPLRLVSSKGGVFRLRQWQEETSSGEDVVALQGADAARAVGRYALGGAHLVGGGTFADLGLARAAKRPASELRFDPANGLFGFVIASASPFLGSAEVRSALSMTLDREKLLKSFNVPGWRQAVSIIPAQMELPTPPAAQDWLALDVDDRLSRAAGLIASWRARNGDVPVLKVAVPKGPGGRLLYASIAADWARLGVRLQMVTSGPSDLRLIDEVAPQASASWYLTRLSCARVKPCSGKGEEALRAAFAAPDMQQQAKKLGEADAAYAVDTPFIPIATPLRWSLVSSDLAGWRPNSFAVHPVDRLKAVKN